MKYLLLLLLSFSLVFANAQTSEIKNDNWYYQYKKGPKVDTTMKVYIDMFLKDCKEVGMNVSKFYKLKSVTFSILPGSVSGVCIPKHRKVYVDASTNSNYPDGLKVLVYHELGHCVLGLAHIPMKSGLAIMNPMLDFQNIQKYYDNWDALMIAFFSDQHPNLKDANNCCPDIIEDPCTHNGDKKKKKK